MFCVAETLLFPFGHFVINYVSKIMSVLMIKYDFLNVWTFSFMAMFISIKCKWSNKNHFQLCHNNPLFSLIQSSPNHVFFCVKHIKINNFGFTSIHFWLDNERNFYTFISTQFPTAVLTPLLSDLQPQITLTQRAMTSSSDKEVMRPQESLDNDFPSKDGGTERCGTYESKWFTIRVYESLVWS